MIEAQEIFKALVNGTDQYTPADLEDAARAWFDAAWTYSDSKMIARAESMIWTAIALGSRREEFKK